MGCNGTAVIIMFSASMLFKGTIFSGMKINHLEMSINFAGVMMALINGIGALSGCISPVMISAIAPNVSDNNNIFQNFLAIFFSFITQVYKSLLQIITFTIKLTTFDIAPDHRIYNSFLKKGTFLNVYASNPYSRTDFIVVYVVASLDR